jgi:S1-C subfamily serine protease
MSAVGLTGARADTQQKSGRAYLGVAAEQNEAGQNGVIVRDVRAESPAGKAGLKDGDRIIMAGDQQVKSFEDLRNAVAAHKPGDKLALKVDRDGKQQTLNVTLGNEPMDRRETRGYGPGDRAGAYLGVFTQALTPDVREHMNLKVDKGVLVSRVLPNSPAAKAGLQDMDVITRADDMAINSPQDLRQAVEKSGVGKELALKVIRGDKTMDVKAQLAQETANTPFGRDGWMPDMPEGFGRFQNRMPMMPGQEKMSALEKKVQDLENRVNELEKKQTK